jgi:hypothetical protein
MTSEVRRTGISFITDENIDRATLAESRFECIELRHIVLDGSVSKEDHKIRKMYIDHCKINVLYGSHRRT